MAERVIGSHRTCEALRELMGGGRGLWATELVPLATRLIIEEGLEAEVRDALDRGFYEHGSQPGGNYRNGLRQGRLKNAVGFIDYSVPQVSGRNEPFRSELHEHLKGHSQALKDLPIDTKS